jgi:hypothetical protein
MARHASVPVVWATIQRVRWTARERTRTADGHLTTAALSGVGN